MTSADAPGRIRSCWLSWIAVQTCEQGEGDAWVIAEDGRIVRRWIDEVPGLALGDPFGVERQFLDAYGIPGKPEDLVDPEGDEDDDKLVDWVGRRVDCLAPHVAAESSLDPTAIGPAAKVAGLMLVADAPTVSH